MNRLQLWKIIQTSKEVTKLEVATQTICDTLGVDGKAVEKRGTIQTTIHNEMKRLERYRKKNDSRSSIDRESFANLPDRNEIMFEDVVPHDERSPVPKRGKCMKKFLDLSCFRKRERTDEIVKSLREFVKEEECYGEPSLSISQLLGYLLYRVNYTDNKKLSGIGAQIMNQIVTSFPEFDETDAVSFKLDLELSREKTIIARRYLTQKGIFFPNIKLILEERKKLKPPITSVSELDNKGVFVPYQEIVKLTIASVFDAVCYTRKVSLDPLLNYRMYLKDGADGAGSQAIWKSRSMNDIDPNTFQHSIVPLRLECIDPNKAEPEVVWRNPAPNSAKWCRPVFLVRMKEMDAATHVVPYTDRERSKLNEESIVVESRRSEPQSAYNVQCNIMDTMKDLKFKKAISGLGGADCILCKSRQSDWMDTECIKKRFPITRSAEETLNLYMELVTRDGTIERKANDYGTREGLTQKPLTTSDQKSICITHSYINVTDWFLKVLVRLNACWLSWEEKENCYGDHIRAGKERIRTKIHEELGLRVMQVAGPLSKGGGSLDGNSGREFFNLKSLPTILGCVGDKLKDDVAVLHKNLSAILRIISSEDKVKLDEFEHLLQETSLHIATKFSWVQINYTLHGMLHHTLELIVLNGGYSIGALSEEALESNNKFVRRFSETLARKSSPVENLTDVMGRLLERSDPYILERQLRIRPTKISCGECCSLKHTTRNHAKAVTLNEYDELVCSILIDSL